MDEVDNDSNMAIEYGVGKNNQVGFFVGYGIGHQACRGGFKDKDIIGYNGIPFDEQ